MKYDSIKLAVCSGLKLFLNGYFRAKSEYFRSVISVDVMGRE
jgi:hypothetical protein